MMRPVTIIVSGPSLPQAARPQASGLEWLPPAKAGDLVELLADPPERLCLIDGLFETCAAPWHKELLLLMAAGTIVFGASSMGALRAAELDRHGMIGVGSIYRAYRDGRLTGDDEVALIHATAQLDWAPLTVPLVEVRATLAAALRSALIDRHMARAMREIASAIHFSDRDWPLLRKNWVAAGCCPPDTAGAVQDRHVPLKRLDALACLAAAQAWRGHVQPPPPPPLTVFVSRLLSQLRRQP